MSSAAQDQSLGIGPWIECWEGTTDTSPVRCSPTTPTSAPTAAAAAEAAEITTPPIVTSDASSVNAFMVDSMLLQAEWDGERHDLLATIEILRAQMAHMVIERDNAVFDVRTEQLALQHTLTKERLQHRLAAQEAVEEIKDLTAKLLRRADSEDSKDREASEASRHKVVEPNPQVTTQVADLTTQIARMRRVWFPVVHSLMQRLEEARPLSVLSRFPALYDRNESDGKPIYVVLARKVLKTLTNGGLLPNGYSFDVEWNVPRLSKHVLLCQGPQSKEKALYAPQYLDRVVGALLDWLARDDANAAALVYDSPQLL